jgi:predicted ABC-type ATPase
LVLGPSAAGKSTFAEKLAVDTKSAIVDSDEAKKVIEGYNNGMGANAVHEESSLMNRAVEAQLTNSGANIIIPTVGSNPSGIGARIDRLKEAGYKVKLVNVRVDKDEATRRMASRALMTGRPIGAGYVREVGDKPSTTYHSLKGKSDGFAEIEASGPRGTDRITESNGLPELEQGRSVLGKSREGGTGCCGSHGGGGIRPSLQKSRQPAGSVKYVDLDRPKSLKAEKKLATRLRRFLREASKNVSDQVREKLRALGKADGDFDTDAFLNSLDFSMFEGLDDEFKEFLEDMYADSGKIALSQLGSRGRDLVDQVNERSVSWAREHAADLAGINEDSPFALDTTTRDMLRATISNGMADNLSAEDIGDAIQEAYAFSEDRADLIATTEIAAANSYGALAGYEEAAAMGIKVRKSWLMLEDACPICSENADAGPIELDEEFPSGDLAPPGHPNCRCVLVPEVEDEADGGEDEAFDEEQLD